METKTYEQREEVGLWEKCWPHASLPLQQVHVACKQISR